MRREEMVLDHEPAVGNPVEKRLAPVPRCMKSNGPPQRTGPPQAEAEDHRGQPRRKQSNWRFARIFSVAQAEQKLHQNGRAPEAERFTVPRLEDPLVNSCKAAGKCVLKISTRQVLLEQADQ